MRKNFWLFILVLYFFLINFHLPANVALSGSAYNETSLLKNDDGFHYGNRSSFHLQLASLTEGIKVVSEIELYTLYGYLSSQTLETSELMKNGQFYIDRLYMKFPVSKLDLTIGKQRIAWGSAIIFRPTDRLNKPNPLSLSGRKEGVNAVLAKMFIGDLSYIEFILAPADTFRYINNEVNLERLRYSKFAMRFMTNLLKSDLANSYFYDGENKNLMIGIDLKGDIKLGYHIESVLNYNKSFKLKNISKQIQSVFGLDYSFGGKWIILGEYIYNGNGLKRKIELPKSNFSLLDEFKYKHYLYSKVLYQHDIFFGINLFAIWNIIDKSLIISPGIRYNIFQNADIQVYNQTFFGDESDEYGPGHLGASQVYYLKLTVKF